MSDQYPFTGNEVYLSMGTNKKRAIFNSTPWKTSDKISILQSLSTQKASVEKQLRYGIIDIVDATNELSMIKQKERKIIKDTVLATHVTRDGKPRKITYQESKDLYYTLMPNKE